MNKAGVRCWVLVVRKILCPTVILSSLILYPSSLLLAQHTRLYACIIGSDAPGSSMGGSSLGAGLWQSDDTAKTWRQLGWKHVKCYSVDVVNKSNGKIIFQACGNGVLRSTDAGLSWRMLTDWRITEVMDIAIDQTAPKNIYIATPAAIWKSNDGGDNWYEADSDIPYPVFVSRIIIDPKNHLKIYAAIDTAIYISNDGGLEWVNAKANAITVHDFVVDDIKRLTDVDKTGILISEDTDTVNTNGGNRSTYYHSPSLYSGANDTVQFQNGKTTNLPEVPKNIHSTIEIGEYILLFGSLDGGVWKYVYELGSTLPVRTGLDSEQVWRLKAVEVK